MNFLPQSQAMHRPRRRWSIWLITFCAIALMFGATHVFAADSISTPDPSGNLMQTPSLVLDSSGNPVIAYRDHSLGDLKIMHCNDPACTGGDESIVAVDTASNVGRNASLQLDAVGFPVVAYRDDALGALKILHCNDGNCAGANESITTPVASTVEQYLSMVLDASGNPVVAYRVGGDDLKILHCNDGNCAGANESITTPDATGATGWQPSLRLDSTGNPVVSFSNLTTSSLMILHCNDVNCAAEGDSLEVGAASPGTGNQLLSSLVLDAPGNPVVSYKDQSNPGLDLWLLHCNDVNCAGGDESNELGDSGWDSSLVLDVSGNPVVAYTQTFGNGSELRLLHCDDPKCILDADGDGVADANDVCPGTATPPVDAGGCSDAQVDADSDGVCDPAAPGVGPSACTGSDDCPGTGAVAVDAGGCSDAQVDADGDGVCDPAAPGVGPSACTGSDDCPGTGAVAVDAGGCSDAQVDADGDGVCDPAAPGVGPSACTGSDDCPGDPEDLDGVSDADGCPEADGERRRHR